ncbi:hypothetical protein [Galbibacter sp. PAP.153]|uniref:hypothetical protein n=1 Tax=Galbibacter sp. PAP.153 TaxID=3104623 RepID=UPI00300B2D3A
MEKITKYPKKEIPLAIRKEVLKALEYFPELNGVSIKFRFKDKLQRSFMQAQPDFKSLWKPKGKRSYYIFISNHFNIEGEKFSINNVPEDVVIGWIGHELGHIVDYLHRSSLNLFFFGIKYVFIGKHIRTAEKTADMYAVSHGMGDYIMKTKNFILNHTSLSEKYKARIKRLYLSPEDIMELTKDIKT